MPAMPPPDPEARRAHLALLAGAVARMSTLGFAVKGWGVALTAGLFALGRPEARYQVGVVALVGCALLWWVDLQVMRIEARFRDHYERVRIGHAPPDFLMDPTRFDPGRRVARGGGALLNRFWGLLSALVLLGILVLWILHAPETS